MFIIISVSLLPDYLALFLYASRAVVFYGCSFFSCYCFLVQIGSGDALRLGINIAARM